jgi:FkbM family methyltransferase
LNPDHIAAQILLRAWPFPRGAGRIIDKLFRHLHFDREIETVRTTDRFDITVMPNDLIGRHLYLSGEFDRSTVEIVCDFAEPGDVLLDIGANIGYVSACFLSNVAGSRVIAVEPQPGVLDLLKQNLDQFGARQVVYPFALSDRDGESFMQIDNENRGASRLSNGGLKIETRSAARLFAEADLSRLDLVKVEIEGHEEEALTSCKTFLVSRKPKIVLFEEHGAKSAGSIGKLLRDVGFDIYCIRKRLTRLDLVPVRSVADCVSNDYVGVSRHRCIPAAVRSKYRLPANRPLPIAEVHHV